MSAVTRSSPPDSVTASGSTARHRLPEVEANAVLLVHAAQERAQLGAERALERHRLRRDDVDLEAARAQRRRHLHADEAGAHDDRAARRGSRAR